MKHLYPFLFLLAATACQSEGPLDETVLPAQAATRSTDEAATLILYAQAQNIGALGIGGYLNNYIETFTVQNMGDAVMSLKWRRPVDPTDGRFGTIADELAHFSPFQLKPTHRYLVFRPKTLDEVATLTADKTIYFSPVPFDHEITGSGRLAHAPAQFDPATETTRIVGSLTPLYTFYPVTKPIPGGVECDWLADLYMPHMLTEELAEAAETPFISATLADMLLDQAQWLSGYKTREELLAEKGWRPSGQIHVYDTAMQQYVGVPNVRVHIGNKGRDVCVLTDKDGRFRMPLTEQPFKGAVSYCIEWATDEYVIHDSSGEPGYYYCGAKSIHPLYLHIRDGEACNIATLARALSLHFYDDGYPPRSDQRSYLRPLSCFLSARVR